MVETDLIELITGHSHVFSNYAMGFLPAAVLCIIHLQQSSVIILFYPNWDYATRNHRLVTLNLGPNRIVVGKKRSAVMPIVSLIAMALVFMVVSFYTLAYILIPMILFHPTFRYDPEKT